MRRSPFNHRYHPNTRAKTYTGQCKWRWLPPNFSPKVRLHVLGQRNLHQTIASSRKELKTVALWWMCTARKARFFVSLLLYSVKQWWRQRTERVDRCLSSWQVAWRLKLEYCNCYIYFHLDIIVYNVAVGWILLSVIAHVGLSFCKQKYAIKHVVL